VSRYGRYLDDKAVRSALEAEEAILGAELGAERGGAPQDPPYSAPTAARPGLTVARGRGMRMWYSAVFHGGMACKRCPSKALNRI